MNKHSGQADRLLSKRSAAEILGVSIRTVERLCSTGRLSKVMVLGAVRLKLSQVESLVAEGMS